MKMTMKMPTKRILVALAVVCGLCILGLIARSVYYKAKLSMINYVATMAPDDDTAEMKKLLNTMNAVEAVPAGDGIRIVQAAYPGVQVKEFHGDLPKNYSRDIVWYSVDTSTGSINDLEYNGYSVAS